MSRTAKVRDLPPPTSSHHLFKGQSQRADSLADTLKLERLISRGIRETRPPSFKQSGPNPTSERMLEHARAVLEITSRHW